MLSALEAAPGSPQQPPGQLAARLFKAIERQEFPGKSWYKRMKPCRSPIPSGQANPFGPIQSLRPERPSIGIATLREVIQESFNSVATAGSNGFFSLLEAQAAGVEMTPRVRALRGVLANLLAREAFADPAERLLSLVDSAGTKAHIENHCTHTMKLLWWILPTPGGPSSTTVPPNSHPAAGKRPIHPHDSGFTGR